ncbi:DUF167 domain-containing protein [Candidatus Peregrinibacteria bacterium]|nr:DUF167 domain-containing protein [Candidatus Peregrinibacteria bacterium]
MSLHIKIPKNNSIEGLKNELTSKKTTYARIKVIPKSKHTEITEKMADGTIKIRIAAPAEKGKANEELLRFLSEQLGISKNNIMIVSGKTERLKLLRIKL